ncbi:GNAT family N-acetyltransferase [Methanoculleus sp. YWC-01]|jgi:ribosomal protein S18 acetylase RimI-like enzyme|uniref:GNAT family N-acetyltransferase n=1 Tax=Methanoculleus nereidis TaxID=2735141 RepID=A0ABU3Z599_9EURY|nr:GNAT family N-acetyltransferase [Methanoculleus sp. YWC-01]MCK9299081.1 GNAT family N-acetyltransferase [Methanoculleus sp.]MDV4344000.1 GNAT family N-acetyltransferase [Methanoculleus sp. YWC-01]PKL55920.1 MAG: GNAT family N-acetyltransferase [Methanomicrobiales archaeon HGW-Methanomicrobiales-6]
MKIEFVRDDRRRFLDLLLIGDEQESMIETYLYRGDLFALYDGDLKSVCVVTCEGDGVYELKNIATYEEFRGQGYGKRLIECILEHYTGRCRVMLVGTGDCPRILRFYERCGFTVSHRVENFFIDHYDHPVFDCGEQLVDMVYLQQEL